MSNDNSLGKLGAMLAQFANEEKVPVIARVEYSSATDKIILPKGMDEEEAAAELIRIKKEAQTIVDVQQHYAAWTYQDVLVAAKKVCEDTFGWVAATTVQTMFGPERPRYIQVCTSIVNGEKQYEECFYGRITLSTWEGALCDVSVRRDGTAAISIETKKKFKDNAMNFLANIERHIERHSIYKNKAVVIDYKETPFGKLADFELVELQPADHIILNRETEMLVNEFVIGELEQEGKRTYLCAGTYGNAKTETCMIVGLEAIKRGMTFFYVKDTSTISLCMSLIRRYAKTDGALLFCEDIDQTAAGEERTGDVNELLNILDGVQGKGQNIKLLLTTNHEKKINAAFRRPGRIDHIIYFKNPTGDVPVRIIQKFCEGHKMDKKIDWDAVSKEIPAQASGSLIAEIGKRVATMARTGRLIDQDLLYTACVSIKAQAEFMSEDVAVDDSLEKAVGVLGYNMFKHLQNDMKEES